MSNQNVVMFNQIAQRYDFLNHFFSLGIDVLWRKRLVQLLKEKQPQLILDLATGTADLAIETSVLNPKKIIGVDPAEEMLFLAREKVAKRGLEHLISLQKASAEALPFPDASFDAVTVAFGVRNFESLLQGLSEVHRVLKPGGTLLILEFAWPKVFPLKQTYNFYMSTWIPFIGGMVSRNKAAYRYLYESAKTFPKGQEFLNRLTEVGF